MVDFQSRDTRRTLGDEEEEGDEETGDTGTDADEASAEAEADGETETTPETEAAPTGDTDAGGVTGQQGGGGTGKPADAADRDPLGAAGAGATDRDEGDDGATGGDPVRPDEQIPMPEGMAYAVLTVEAATGVDAATDPGETAVAALDGAEATVATRGTVDPSYDAIQRAVVDLVERRDVSVVLTLGGVGVGPAAVTPEAVEPLFDQSLPGFGELYRALSHEQEGTAVLRSRVTAGLVGPVPVFCLPGEPAAARRAIDRLVRSEAKPLVEAARADGS